MLVAARLRYVSATRWGTKRYLQMNLLAEVVAIAWPLTPGQSRSTSTQQRSQVTTKIECAEMHAHYQDKNASVYDSLDLVRVHAKAVTPMRPQRHDYVLGRRFGRDLRWLAIGIYQACSYTQNLRTGSSREQGRRQQSNNHVFPNCSQREWQGAQ